MPLSDVRHEYNVHRTETGEGVGHHNTKILIRSLNERKILDFAIDRAVFALEICIASRTNLRVFSLSSNTKRPRSYSEVEARAGEPGTAVLNEAAEISVMDRRLADFRCR